MTSLIPISSALQRNLAQRTWRDDALARDFESGVAVTRKASVGPAKAIRRVFSKYISNVTRSHPRSPDRIKSTKRRRKLGGSSCMPDTIREHYTEAERAALWVVVQEVKRHGRCEIEINQIAIRAGVSRTTVQNAIRKAKREDYGHLSVELRPGIAGRLSMTNIIRITSAVWQRWIGVVKGGFKSVNPSEIKGQNASTNASVDRSQGAYERERAGRTEPTIEPTSDDEVERRQSAHGAGFAERAWRRFGRSSVTGSVSRGVV